MASFFCTKRKVGKIMFKVVISGRITKDPEIKIVEKGKVCNFTIAAINSKKETSFLRCSVWNKMAEAIEEYVKKGKQLFILGDGSIKKFKGNDDIERDVLNISCDIVEFGSESKLNDAVHDIDISISEEKII